MNRGTRWLLALLPLALLGILLVVLQQFGPGKAFRTQFPPVEELAFKRIVLKGSETVGAHDKQIIAHVVNDGPDPITVAQVMVDEAYWAFTMEPSQTLKHLQSARIKLIYPWGEGDTHEIKLITETGVTFVGEIGIAVASPVVTGRYLGMFALLGVYVGVIPVFLGLLWFPAMRQLTTRTLNFLLSLTAGLLVFLAVDALHEAVEVTEELPGSYEGIALVAAGFGGSWLLLMVISRWSRTLASKRDETFQRLVLSYTIAVGIGLHNLGEGLAIGSAYTLGNIALGGMLVMGFAIHNTTEGLAIIAPVARQRVKLSSLIIMGLLAGVLTIFGAWIGGFTYSAVWSVLFLGVGAGAIVQVVYAILRQVGRDPEEAGVLAPLNFAGLAVGFMLMYATGMLVTF